MLFLCRVGHSAHKQDAPRGVVLDQKHKRPIGAKYRRRRGQRHNRHNDARCRGGLGPFFIDLYKGLVDDVGNIEVWRPFMPEKSAVSPKASGIPMAESV